MPAADPDATGPIGPVRSSQPAAESPVRAESADEVVEESVPQAQPVEDEEPHGLGWLLSMSGLGAVTPPSGPAAPDPTDLVIESTEAPVSGAAFFGNTAATPSITDHSVSDTPAAEELTDDAAAEYAPASGVPSRDTEADHALAGDTSADEAAVSDTPAQEEPGTDGPETASEPDAGPVDDTPVSPPPADSTSTDNEQLVAEGRAQETTDAIPAVDNAASGADRPHDLPAGIPAPDVAIASAADPASTATQRATQTDSDGNESAQFTSANATDNATQGGDSTTEVTVGAAQADASTTAADVEVAAAHTDGTSDSTTPINTLTSTASTDDARLDVSRNDNIPIHADSTGTASTDDAPSGGCATSDGPVRADHAPISADSISTKATSTNDTHEGASPANDPFIWDTEADGAPTNAISADDGAPPAESGDASVVAGSEDPASDVPDRDSDTTEDAPSVGDTTDSDVSRRGFQVGATTDNDTSVSDDQPAVTPGDHDADGAATLTSPMSSQDSDHSAPVGAGAIGVQRSDDGSDGENSIDQATADEGSDQSGDPKVSESDPGGIGVSPTGPLSDGPTRGASSSDDPQKNAAGRETTSAGPAADDDQVGDDHTNQPSGSLKEADAPGPADQDNAAATSSSSSEDAEGDPTPGNAALHDAATDSAGPGGTAVESAPAADSDEVVSTERVSGGAAPKEDWFSPPTDTGMVVPGSAEDPEAGPGEHVSAAEEELRSDRPAPADEQAGQAAGTPAAGDASRTPEAPDTAEPTADAELGDAAANEPRPAAADVVEAELLATGPVVASPTDPTTIDAEIIDVEVVEPTPDPTDPDRTADEQTDDRPQDPHQDGAQPRTGSAALRTPSMQLPVLSVAPPPEPVLEPVRRRAEPEEVLAAYPWKLDLATLREVAEDPEPLLAVRDRLTDKLEYAERDAVRARLLSLRAVVSRVLGDLGRALADAREALRHAEADGDLRSIAVVRARLAHVQQWRGDYAEADRLFAESGSVELPDRLRAEVHVQAGKSGYEQGRYLEACNHFEAALELRRVADPDLVARTEVSLDAVMERVRESGWGPYPRSPEEILQQSRPPQPALDYDSGWQGYADSTGEVVIPERYAEVQPFHEGVAWVRRPGTAAWELIDETGALVIDPSSGYVQAGPFAGGLAWVSREPDGGFFAVDWHNRVIVPGGFAEVRAFRNGLALVRRDGWGAVDRHGRVVVPLKYQGFATELTAGGPVEGFTADGLAVVDAGDRLGVLDRTGQLQVAPVHARLLIHPTAFLIGNTDGLWGALDRTGEPIVDVTWSRPADVVDEIERLLSGTRPVL